MWHLQKEIEKVENHYINQLNMLAASKTGLEAELQCLRNELQSLPVPKVKAGGQALGHPQVMAGPPLPPPGAAARPALPRPALHNGIVRADAVGGRVVEAATRSVSDEIQVLHELQDMHDLLLKRPARVAH